MPIQFGLLAQEARHRLRRPLPRPVRVGRADDVDALVQGRPLTALPRLRQAVAGSAAEEDDLAALHLRVQHAGEVLAEAAEILGDERVEVLAGSAAGGRRIRDDDDAALRRLAVAR